MKLNSSPSSDEIKKFELQAHELRAQVFAQTVAGLVSFVARLVKAPFVMTQRQA